MPMIKKAHAGFRIFTLSIVWIALLSAVACAGKKSDPSANIQKEPDKMFDQKGVDYPIRFANYQHNSLSPAQVKARVALSWTRKFSDELDNAALMPHSVLLHPDYIGVSSTQHLLIYRTRDGLFQYMMPLAQNTPTIFGREAFAYFNPATLLYYRDYAGNALLENVTVSGFEEWSYLLLFHPGMDAYLSAVQFTGGPRQKSEPREPKRYAVYRQPNRDLFPVWQYEGDGEITHALLTGDHLNLVLLHNNKVVVLNATSGKQAAAFTLDYQTIHTASLNTHDQLIVIGQGPKGKGERTFLSAADLSGNALWFYELRRPLFHQPPAWGPNGSIFVTTADGIGCVKDGKLQWIFALKGDRNTWITIAQDNTAVVIHDRCLIFIDGTGKQTFKTDITTSTEHFDAPAAIGNSGGVFIAGDQKLYCFQ